jgi:hypothetical protein
MYEVCAYCGSKLELTSSTIEDTKRFEEQTYQARLDNVLSKFEHEYINGAPYKKITRSTHIVFFVDEFRLRNDCADQSIKISLETVESLLEDLSNE